jgi:hypothetical protein
MVLEAVAELGIKDLTVNASSVFDIHERKSSKSGTLSGASSLPALSAKSSSSVIFFIAPLPFVVLSTVSSCISISSRSFVRRTSVSIISAPASYAAANAVIVFSK